MGSTIFSMRACATPLAPSSKMCAFVATRPCVTPWLDSMASPLRHTNCGCQLKRLQTPRSTLPLKMPSSMPFLTYVLSMSSFSNALATGRWRSRTVSPQAKRSPLFPALVYLCQVAKPATPRWPISSVFPRLLLGSKIFALLCPPYLVATAK
ncbi:unannotated protein [freshwater metagenome]|uniref:Unannotated protein n=1 Tax=freshwater metagenome TaxID=449393 RepID=A0A6J6H0Z5_9ZZZZ